MNILHLLTYIISDTFMIVYCRWHAKCIAYSREMEYKLQTLHLPFSVQNSWSSMYVSFKLDLLAYTWHIKKKRFGNFILISPSRKKNSIKQCLNILFYHDRMVHTFGTKWRYKRMSEKLWRCSDPPLKENPSFLYT